MVKHLNIRIYGRVQGVFFRQFIFDKAKSLNISGLVENLSDGSVYVEAEGTEENLKELLNWCRQGPKFAKIEKVEFEFSDELKHFQEFLIK